MRAIVVDRWMEPDELVVSDAPEPELTADGVAIDVRAAGCNFYDILICQGRYQVKPPFPFTPGGEVAGVVSAVGPEVRGIAIGDRICATPWSGGYAERAVAKQASVWRIPESMSFDEGAAFPIVYPTSYAALVNRAQLQPGETVLVHAAAGGVGLAAVQIATALGARVIATAGGADKLQIAADAGAEVLIDYREEDFRDRVLEATDGRGADVIYDSVGGDTFDRSLRCIAWNGRLLVIGFAGGTIPQAPANHILLKNIAVVGLHWSAYEEKEPEAIPKVFEALFALYEKGGVRPLIQRAYPLEEAPAALRELAGRRTVGKVVLHP